MAPGRVRIARSSPAERTTVRPVGRSGRTHVVVDGDAGASSRPATCTPKSSSPDGRHQRHRPPEPGESVGGDPRRAADDERRCVEQLLGLPEPGNHVAAQHQVGVGVADDEHAGRRHGGSTATILTMIPSDLSRTNQL